VGLLAAALWLGTPVARCSHRIAPASPSQPWADPRQERPIADAFMERTRPAAGGAPNRATPRASWNSAEITGGCPPVSLWASSAFRSDP
jgi:hypothetical protein